MPSNNDQGRSEGHEKVNTMNTNRSIEERQVFVAFALACARVLEHPECPREMAEAINDLANTLADLIGPASPRAVTIALLHGLVARAESGDGKARLTIEKRNGVHSERKQIGCMNGFEDK